MSTQIKLNYCGMPGEGPTVREAKQDAARKIEAVLQLNYTPTVMSWKGRTGLVWNTPSGVCSGYLLESGTGLSGTCFHGTAETMENACAQMRMNLAQCGADVESDEIPAIIKGESRNAIADYERWLGFQRAYRWAKGQGLNDVDAHTYACNNGESFRPKTK